MDDRVNTSKKQHVFVKKKNQTKNKNTTTPPPPKQQNQSKREPSYEYNTSVYNTYTLRFGINLLFGSDTNAVGQVSNTRSS